MRQRWLWAFAACTFAALTAVAGAAALGGGSGKLSKADRAIVAAHAADGTPTTLLIAAKSGASSAVADAVSKLGGKVEYSNSAIDYLRVSIAADKADAVSKLDGVQAVEADKVIPIDDPAPSAADTEVAPPGPTTPSENGYMPTRDIGAPQFVEANPTYDGRGVVIGILDTGVDLLTPELQSAKTLDGTNARKIIDWRTATDPLTDNDPTWLDMSNQVTAAGGTFTYNGTTYTAPADGTYRIATFSEASLGNGSEYGNCPGATPTAPLISDLNRDGDCTDSWAVLWDGGSMVWVDTNQNNSFADQTAMTDYKVNHDQSTFGTDNPSTPVRESVPFVVQVDGKDKYVNIGIVAGAHATHVAGIAAGKGFFGGTSYNGAAPNAQIVSVRACMFVAGCTAHALIEGMIYLEKQANVDVINMSIGGLPALNDGNNARAVLYNRLIAQGKAQMFISAGNSYGNLNTVGDPSVATDVVSVGAYITSDTYDKNYGATVSTPELMHVFSSRGPREDGGFKPNIVAPGSAVSTIPAWQNPAGQCLAYTCPPGYAMFNGTSMAAPESTGGTALLISAAKQAGVQWQPDQVRQAIYSSARFVSGIQANAQGNGLFQVGAAWNLLKQNIKTVDITSSAPVNTVLKGFLATPGKGPGIYEREGLKPGDSGDRVITFTRTSGGAKPITYNLTWVGSSVFGSASSISLPLNTPVDLTVHFSALPAGISSALLKLDDPSTAGVDYETMNTLVAAYQFDEASNFTVSTTSSVGKADTTSFFYNVPANTPALKIDLTGINGRIRFIRYHPYGVNIDSTSLAFQTGGTQSRTLTNPLPGVWEVMVEASRTTLVDPATFTITASLLGASVDPAVWVTDPAIVGTTYNQTYTFHNLFGAFTGNAVGTALASVFSTHPTIAATGPQQTYDINVPAGSTNLTVTIGNASDNAADLDLYVYDCHTGSCALAGSSTSGSANENVSINNPSTGHWVALVDPFAVPAGSTTYDYTDAIANPAYGSVTVTDASALHPHNDTWTAPASVKALAVPGTGRYLRGFVQVKSGSAVIGSGEVDLKNVTP